jgi:hypothetical protein
VHYSEPGLESVFDIDLASNNLYSALFVLTYERHNSSAGSSVSAGPDAGSDDIRRVRFGPTTVEALSRCSIVFNPSSSAAAAAAAVKAAAATATAGETGPALAPLIYNLSNFAGQRIAPNTRLDLATGTINHIRSPTHLFAMHDDYIPPSSDPTILKSSTTTDADTDTGADPFAASIDASVLPPQFIRSRPKHVHPTDGNTVLLETELDRRRKTYVPTASRRHSQRRITSVVLLVVCCVRVICACDEYD